MDVVKFWLGLCWIRKLLNSVQFILEYCMPLMFRQVFKKFFLEIIHRNSVLYCILSLERWFALLSSPFCQTTKIPPCWFLLLLIYMICDIWYDECVCMYILLAIYNKPGSSFFSPLPGIEVSLKPSIIQMWNGC